MTVPFSPAHPLTAGSREAPRPTPFGSPVAIVLERNKLVNRRIARVVACAGYEVCAYEDAATVDGDALARATLILADAFDAAAVLGWLVKHATLSAALYSAEARAIDRLFARAVEAPRLVALVGRGSFEAPPREDTLLHVAGRALGQQAAPFSAHLAWGAAGFAYTLASSADRDHAVAETIGFASRLGAPRRTAEMLGELAHELIMNALYDAPVDGEGRPRFAHDRKQDVTLAASDAAVFRCGSDGVRVAVEVADRFGRLTRKDVFGGLGRALAQRDLDTSGGGAGLGMLVCYRATTELYYDVAPGRQTRVTGVFDLDLNFREFRMLPKTIHFPDHRRDDSPAAGDRAFEGP